MDSLDHAGEAAPTRVSGAAPDAPEADPSVGTTFDDAPQARDVLLAGTRMGRYVLVRRLGEGGMGAVYEAFDPELDRHVALKVIRANRHTTDDAEEWLERLRREAQALAQLAHPAIVPVYDVGEDAEDVYVAMKLIGGRTLRQWAREKPRSWREVVARLIEAGRGLAAAHAVGLVHRDFKPDNVLVDETGHAVVVDFGLAAPRGASRSPTLPIAEDDEAFELDSARLTRTGIVMGTPAYMAPEQSDRRDQIDPRSDQFAFCVSAWELLHGARPFIGESAQQLLVAKRKGTLVDPPAGRRIPSRLRHALERGMLADPDARWPSMSALLQALARATKRRRRVTATTLALAGAGAAVALTLLARDPTCADIGEKEAPWSPTAQEQLRAAFLATGATFAEPTTRRLEARFDAWQAAWSDTHARACALPSDDAARDRTMACLRRASSSARSLLAVLGSADRSVIARALDAAEVLPDPEACARPSSLAAPSDKALAHEVERIHDQLAEAEAMQRAGRYADALERTEAALAAAQATGWGPVIAAAELRRGDLRIDRGEYAVAEHDLGAAVHSAEAAGADALVALAATRLAFVVGVQLVRPDEARRWVRTAEVALARAGDEPAIAARLELTIAQILLEDRDTEGARAHAQRALERAEALYGPEDTRVATALRVLGSIAAEAGEWSEAIEWHERALVTQETALGPDHPALVAMLNNVARAKFRALDGDGARPYHERALALVERTLGPDHPDAGYAHIGLGAIAYMHNHFDDALVSYRRALAIWEHSYGADHPMLAHPINNIALILQRRDHRDEALVHMERALRIAGTAYGEHPDIVVMRRNVGGLLFDMGRPRDALARYEEALAMSGRLAHTDHHLRALLFRDLARAHEALGHEGTAIEHLERSLDEYDATSEETGDGKAETTLALARLVPDAARARALALLALELAREPATRAQIEAHIGSQLARPHKRGRK